MLPPSHVAYTWLTTSLIKSLPLTPRPSIDYRLLAIAAIGPDLIDKPLAALYFYRKYKSAVLFAHSLLVNLLICMLWLRYWPRHKVYLLAFLGHMVLDRLWFFPNTFWWPLRGWRFHVWGKRGSEQSEMGKAYWYAFTRRPELWGWELGGLLALIWFVWRHRLWKWENLWQFVRHGRVDGF